MWCIKFLQTLQILLKSLEELLCENKRFRFVMKLRHSKFFFIMKKRLHSHLEMKLNDEEKKKGRHSHSIHSTIQTNCSLNLFQFMRTKSIANWHTTVNGLIRFSNYPQIHSRFSLLTVDSSLKNHDKFHTYKWLPAVLLPSQSWNLALQRIPHSDKDPLIWVSGRAKKPFYCLMLNSVDERMELLVYRGNILIYRPRI